MVVLLFCENAKRPRDSVIACSDYADFGFGKFLFCGRDNDGIQCHSTSHFQLFARKTKHSIVTVRGGT